MNAYPEIADAELVAEIDEHVVDRDGLHYVARIYGCPRSDGAWVGWLEFVAIGEHRRRRTDVETAQATRLHLFEWASRIEPTYLEGAFARASSNAAPVAHAELRRPTP